MIAETNAADARQGRTRSDSEVEMIAEKAALLGKDDEDADNEETSSSRHRSRQPSPLPQRTSEESATVPTIQPLSTPGDSPVSDPLSQMPSAETTVPEPGAPLSEKARGKMRATESVTSLTSPRSTSGELADEELLSIASAGVGPNGYVPTQEWVSSWQKG